MKVVYTILLLFIIGLTVTNSSNLQTDVQSSCPAGLLQKMNNPPQVSGINDFINLIDTINTATDALTVVNQIATFNKAHMDNFFFLAQAIYQTEVDYQQLDPALVEECQMAVEQDYCLNSCEIPTPYAQMPAPKPQICNPDLDPFCDNSAQNTDQQKKCKKAIRPYKLRHLKEPDIDILIADLLRTFAGSGMCVDDEFINAFVPRDCMQLVVRVFKERSLTSLPMFKQGDSFQGIQSSLAGENLMTQLQSAYLLSREKFGHGIAEISMACKVYINTNPMSDEEVDALMAGP